MECVGFLKEYLDVDLCLRFGQYLELSGDSVSKTRARNYSHSAAAELPAVLLKDETGAVNVVVAQIADVYFATVDQQRDTAVPKIACEKFVNHSLAIGNRCRTCSADPNKLRIEKGFDSPSHGPRKMI